MGNCVCLFKLKTNDQTEQKNPIKSSLYYPVPRETLKFVKLVESYLYQQ